MAIKALDTDKVGLIYNATSKYLSTTEISKALNIPNSTIRLYCATMVKQGKLTKSEDFPAKYIRVARKDWPNSTQTKEKLSRDSIVELKTRIKLGEDDPNELIKLTQNIYRNIGGDKLKAVAKLYAETAQALAELVEEN